MYKIHCEHEVIHRQEYILIAKNIFIFEKGEDIVLLNTIVLKKLVWKMESSCSLEYLLDQNFLIPVTHEVSISASLKKIHLGIVLFLQKLHG